jgi:hypothetical protein
MYGNAREAEQFQATLSHRHAPELARAAVHDLVGDRPICSEFGTGASGSPMQVHALEPNSVLVCAGR